MKFQVKNVQILINKLKHLIKKMINFKDNYKVRKNSISIFKSLNLIKKEVKKK